VRGGRAGMESEGVEVMQAACVVGKVKRGGTSGLR
jgi:hypothetical protein